MRARAGLVALLLLAAGAPEVLAAKPVCKIVTDARGDAEYPTNGVPGDDGDDLLSADLASDGTRLTAVWRLAALRAPNPAAPLGQGFLVFFQAPGTQRQLYLEAVGSPNPRVAYGWVDSQTSPPALRELGVGKGVLDARSAEARATVPTRGFAAVSARLNRGSRLRSIDVQVGRVVIPRQPNVGVPLISAVFDEAQGTPYTIGTPSCARPVR